MLREHCLMVTRIRILPVFLLLSLVRAQAQPSIDSALVLYLPFHAESRDESVWRHPVVAHHAAYGPDRHGQADGAYYCNGTDAFLEIPPTPALDLPGSLTLSLWMKIEEPLPTNAVLTLVSRSDDTEYASLQVGIGGAGLHAYAYCEAKELSINLFHFLISSPQQWYHIAISLDTIRKEGRLYFNGQLRSTTPLVSRRIVQSDRPIILGSRITRGVPAEVWKGWMDDVRVYNRALQADEVQALIEGYVFPSPALAYEPTDHLEPGRYILVAVNERDSLLWQPYLYEVLAKEPVWKKSWFLGLIVTAVAAFSILGAWFFYRQRQLEQSLEFEKIRALEAERFRIAREMHEDIGTGLSAINLLTDMALHKNLSPDLAVEIEHIAASGRKVSDRIQEIVWTIDMRHDSMEHLVQYFQQYATDILHHSGATLNLVLPPRLPAALLAGNIRRMLFLAFKEALNNILKHAHATQVDIEFAITNKHLTLRIQDNGRGFDPALTSGSGNGLTNMHKRMEDIGGQCRITSGMRGTEVVFRVAL